MEIKKISKKEIMQTVEVHKDSFKGFFLTELGDHFLKVYYDCVRKDTRGLLLGFYDGGKLLGFCAATFLANGFNLHIVKKNFFRFLIVGLGLFVKNPRSLLRLLHNFSKTDASKGDNGNYAELLSIAVDGRSQGKGIGRKLLMQLENELLVRGCTSLSLTTDSENNEKTIQFYLGLGYEIYYDFSAYPSRKMYRMIKKLTD